MRCARECRSWRLPNGAAALPPPNVAVGGDSDAVKAAGQRERRRRGRDVRELERGFDENVGDHDRSILFGRTADAVHNAA